MESAREEGTSHGGHGGFGGPGTRHSGRRCRIGFQPVAPVTAPRIGQCRSRAPYGAMSEGAGHRQKTRKRSVNASSRPTAQPKILRVLRARRFFPNVLGRNPQAKFTAACFALERHSRSQAIRKTLTS